MKVWILALIGAILGATGDWLIMLSAKTGNMFLLYVAMILFGLCGIPWYLLLKYHTGWITGSVIWGVIGVVFSLILSIMSNEKQSTIQWIGFIIMLIGIAIRSIKF